MSALISSESGYFKVLNVGLISFGLSGRIFHGPFLATNPHFKLVSVYERSKTESIEFAHKHGLSIKLVRSEKELVEQENLDLVVVCSPIEFHFEHAMLALQAGKHVLVEKAFCSTSAQAIELLRFASEKGLVCIPYQNRRYDADFLTIQRILPSLGKIAEYNGYYNRYSPTVRPENWKDTVVGSGGNFLSLGSHMIDQAVVLFGIPDRVFGDVRAQREGAVIDDAWEVHLFYDCDNVASVDEYGLRHGGFRAILKGSLLCKDHAMRYMIHGSDASWTKKGVDTQEGQLMAGALPEYFSAGGVQDESGIHRETVEYGCEPGSQWGVLTTDGAVHTPPVRGSYHFLYDALYDTIVHKAVPIVDVNLSVAVLRIIELARESSTQGRVLPYVE